MIRRTATGPVSVAKPADKHGRWLPKAVRDMPPLDAATRRNISKTQAAFTLDFLTTHLNAAEWSPGFYMEREQSDKARHSFYIVDPTIDAHGPFAPGKHGAKLVPFCHDDDEDGPLDEYNNCPLFVASGTASSKSYVYFGHYAQTRYSDYLDHETMSEHVSRECRLHWATWLSAPTRPDWVHTALKDHFWAQPAYEGSGDDESLQMHAEDLRDWLVTSNQQIKRLRPQQILDAFEAAETADPPGLRLQWEYLQCVGYDHAFHDELISHDTLAKAMGHSSNNASPSKSPTGWDIAGPAEGDFATPTSSDDNSGPAYHPPQRQHPGSRAERLVVDTTSAGAQAWPLPGRNDGAGARLPRGHGNTESHASLGSRRVPGRLGIRYTPPHRR